MASYLSISSSDFMSGIRILMDGDAADSVEMWAAISDFEAISRFFIFAWGRKEKNMREAARGS